MASTMQSKKLKRAYPPTLNWRVGPDRRRKIHGLRVLANQRSDSDFLRVLVDHLAVTIDGPFDVRDLILKRQGDSSV
jgi:hypothetical protein